VQDKTHMPTTADPRRCRAVVSRGSARALLTREPSDGGRDFRFTPNNGHDHVNRIGLLSANNGSRTHSILVDTG
jgi:hypothetical protein